MSIKQKKMDFIKDLSKLEKSVTNWHWSDDLLEYWEEFHDKNSKTSKVQKDFTLHCSFLVKEGFLRKPLRFGIGIGAYNEFGSRTQTVWIVVGSYKDIHVK